MKENLHRLNSWLTAVFSVIALTFVMPLQAQDAGFRPYKGICWGIFYDSTAEVLTAGMIPVSYVRPVWNKFVFPNFVECGKDLTLNVTNPYNNEGYFDITLEMEGAAYDDKGFFYPPFNSGEYTWVFRTPNDQLIGPIHMPTCYYHEPLDYIGLLYVRYPEREYGYFDLKMSEDFYESVPRTSLDDEEIAYYNGIEQVKESSSASSTYYDFLGRRTTSAAHGLVIERGHKVLR